MRASLGEECFGLVDQRRGSAVINGCQRRVQLGAEALDLLDVEDGIGLHEGDFAFGFFAVLARLGLGETIGKNDYRAALPLWTCVPLSAACL